MEALRACAAPVTCLGATAAWGNRGEWRGAVRCGDSAVEEVRALPWRDRAIS